MGDLIDFFDGEIEPEATPETEWVGMPEFVQEKKEAYATIKIRFDNEEDLQEFSKMIGQPLTNRTKSIWHPPLVRGLTANLRWDDEE